MLEDHLDYHAKFHAVLEEMITTGPSSCKKLPDFCPPPKRKLSALYGPKPKRAKTRTPEDLHKYLKSKLVDASIMVRKDVFAFSIPDITTTDAAVPKLTEGFKQIQRQEATSMIFNLQYGVLLEKTFTLFEKENKNAPFKTKWEDWLKRHISICPSYSRKLRELGRLLNPVINRFGRVGLSFYEVYNMKAEIQAMFESSEEIREFWRQKDTVLVDNRLQRQSS